MCPVSVLFLCLGLADIFIFNNTGANSALVAGLMFFQTSLSFYETTCV